MTKRFVIAGIVSAGMLILGVLGASAAPLYQATATWNPYTPPSTPTEGGSSSSMFPTVIGTDYGLCISGGATPIGYGSVTPDAMWSFYCETCLPASATPTEWGWDWPTHVPHTCITAEGPYPELCYTVTPGGPTSTATVAATVTGTVTAASCFQLTQTAVPTWTPGSTPTAVGETLVEFENTGAINYSTGWSTSSNASAHGGQYRGTVTTNAWATYNRTWNGTQHLKVYAVTDNTSGYLDIEAAGIGTLAANVDLYSASTTWQVLVADVVPPAGTYNIEFWNHHEKNGASSNYYTWLDYLTVDGAVSPTNTAYPTFTPWPPYYAMDCAAGGLACSEWGNGVYYVGGGENYNMPWTDPNPIAWEYHVKVVTDGNSIVGLGDATFAPRFTNSGGSTLYTFPDHACGSEYCADAGTYEFNAFNDTQDRFEWRAGLYGYSIGSGTEIWISPTYCIEGATPTAQPGGSSSFYCGAINNDFIGDGSDIEFWGTEGPPVCLTTPAFELDWIAEIFNVFSAVLPDGVTDFVNAWARSEVIPAQTFCFQVYDFLAVVILGVQVQWTWFINLLIAVFVLHHFMTR